MQTNSTPSDPQPNLAGDDRNLLDIMIVLAKNKERIFITSIVAAIVASGFSLTIPNSYTGKAQILPPQAGSGSSAMLGQLGALGGLAGASLGIKNPTDTYVGILNSRRVSDSLIQRFQLQRVYETKLPTDTRTQLKSASVISTGKDGMIVIEVTDRDPTRAATLTNAYVEELQKLTQTLAVTEASQRRLFFEKQLRQAKEDLSTAEIALKQVQERTGLIQLSNQAESAIRAASGLKAQIAGKEVELSAMRTFATTNNPDFIRTQQEIVGLRAQLTKIETGANMGNGDISVPTSKVPEAGLEYMRRLRDVKYYETIFELIAKQFELAKIDEAKEGSLIQVLDSAVVPDKKSKPARSIIVLLATLGAGFLAVCWAFIRETSGQLKSDPENNSRIQTLRTFSRWKARRAPQSTVTN